MSGEEGGGCRVGKNGDYLIKEGKKKISPESGDDDDPPPPGLCGPKVQKDGAKKIRTINPRLHLSRGLLTQGTVPSLFFTCFFF